MMDRAAMRAAFETVLDNLEEAQRENDPVKVLAAEAAAHEAWQQLASMTVAPIYRRRQFAAMAKRRPDDPDIVADDSTAFRFVVNFQPVQLREPENQSAARRVLARFVDDNRSQLPAGLGALVAAALEILNTGDDSSWIAKPHRMPGASGRQGQKDLADKALLLRIYHYSGYHQRGIEDSATEILSEGGEPPERREAIWERLKQFRKRRGFARYCQEFRAMGEAEREAGKPYAAPIGDAYSVKEVERFRRG